VQWVLGYLDACGLQRVVLMGCSMGSAIGLALLARPERFAGRCCWRRRTAHWAAARHPEVHGSRLGAACRSLLSPASPVLRDRYLIYSQAAPGIYDGDLAFYSDDFDAHAHTARIDTARTPLWLLTGDYDYSATPADSARVAQEVPGALFTALPGFGHFPMVENPEGLLPHLLSPLDALWQHAQETIR
jgi:pimeloyl-ACP methyl ester carboxylesterase